MLPHTRILAIVFVIISWIGTYAQVAPDSTSLLKDIKELEDGMLTDYPVNLKKAKVIHHRALTSPCVDCQVKSHRLLGRFFFVNGEYQNGLQHFRRAIVLASSLNDSKTKANLLDLIGNTYYYQAYYDSAAYFFNEAYQIHKRNNDVQGMITVTHNVSLMYHRKGNFQKSIEYLFREAELKDKLPVSVYEIEAMGGMGSLMIDSIYYVDVIASELKVLKTYQRENDNRSVLRTYRNIGKAYRQLERYRQSARYFVKAALVADKLGLVPDWDLPGADYRQAEMKDSSFYYHYTAKRYFSRATQPSIAGTLEMLGNSHRYFGNPDSAAYYYNAALRMSYAMNNRITFTGIHRNLVNVYTQLGDFTQAEYHLGTGLALAKEVALIHEKNLYNEGKLLYEKKGDYKMALFFSEKYRTYLDSINRAETAINLTRMQAEFKTVKKTREVEELNQKNLLSQAQMETRNLQMLFALALLLVISAVGWLYYLRYRQKAKSNQANEILLAEIHHRVKNNLQIISSLINLRTRQTTSAETTEALQQLNRRIFSMGLIHDKLYRSEHLQTIRLDEYISEVSQHLLASFEELDCPIHLKLDCQPVDSDVDKALTCGLIANELITNAVKYAFGPGQSEREIEVSLRQNGDTVLFGISDNGEANQEPPENHKKSFGSRFVDQLVNIRLGGEMMVETHHGFHISIRFNIFT